MNPRRPSLDVRSHGGDFHEAAQFLPRSLEEYYRDMLPILVRQRQAILDLAAHYGLRNVRVFGSTRRGEDGPDSDIDLLVEVDPGRTLRDVIGFEQDVEALLARPVDVVTEAGLSPYLQGRILAEAAAL